MYGISSKMIQKNTESGTGSWCPPCSLGPHTYHLFSPLLSDLSDPPPLCGVALSLNLRSIIKKYHTQLRNYIYVNIESRVDCTYSRAKFVQIFSDSLFFTALINAGFFPQFGGIKNGFV